MQHNRIHAQARFFGECAKAYRTYRPSYPNEAIAQIIRTCGLRPADRVCDLGAGPGVLSVMLAERGMTVVAVDPVAEMIEVGRREAMRRHLAVAYCQAVAESLSLANNSVRAVISGQAFHWFDAEQAFAEVHRVLVPGGGLALLWYARDWEKSDWLRQLECLIRKFNPAYEPNFYMQDWASRIDHTGYFGPVERSDYVRSQYVSQRFIMGLIGTFSYVRVLPDSVRAELEEEMAALADRRLRQNGPEEIAPTVRQTVMGEGRAGPARVQAWPPAGIQSPEAT